MYCIQLILGLIGVSW